MSKFKSTALALAVAGAVAAVPAQAYVMASSVVQLENFTIHFSSDGSTVGAQVQESDLKKVAYNSNADLEGDLTGYTAYDLTSGVANTDFPVQCIGSGCGALGLGENAFTNIMPPPVGDYSAGDQFEEGTPVIGLNGVSPATIKNSAYAALVTGGGDGSANSNNGLSSTFEFELNNDSYLAFTGFVQAFLAVVVTADEIDPGTAQAQYTFGFSIREAGIGGLNVWSYTPDLLGLGGQSPVGVNAVGIDDGIIAVNPGVSFTEFTPLLEGGKSYVLTARMNSNVDVKRTVPEPGALALLGLGLAALGFNRRRKTA